VNRLQRRMRAKSLLKLVLDQVLALEHFALNQEFRLVRVPYL
jgi:hypothetical protein